MTDGDTSPRDSVQEAGDTGTRDVAQRTGEHAGDTTPAPAAPHQLASVPVLALGGFTASLINTLPVPLLPFFPRLLGTSAANVSWTVTAALLVAAVWTPISGRLGDMYGKRTVLLWCLALMIGGSVLCALTDSVTGLIAGRACQGFAAGALPLGLSIMRDQVPRERLGKAMAIMSSTVGVGGTVGFPVSAYLSQHTDWHVLFWAVAGLGAVNLLLVFGRVPASGVRFGGRFDWPGTVGLSVALTSLLLVLSKGRDWGWTSTSTLASAALTVVVGACWVRYELATDQPLVDLRITARRPVLATNVATLFVGFAMFGISLVLPQVLQAPTATTYGAGYSMVESGLCLSVAGLVMMIAAPLSSTVSAKWGSRATFVIGAVVLACGYAVGLPLLSGGWWLAILCVLVGAGLAFTFAAMPALLIAGTPTSQTAAANGLNSLIRSVGAALCSAVTGAVLAAMTSTVTVDGAPRVVPTQSGLSLTLLATAAAGVAAAVAALCVPKSPV